MSDRHFSETHYVPFLEAYLKAMGNNEYYEQVLRVITMLEDAEIRAKRVNGQKWYEIDDVQDLDIASVLFCEDEERKVRQMSERYGGYWRFPNLKDFCYLVNPYYPPQKMKDEISASFDTLLTQYPSGMKVNAMLAAKNFGVRAEQIVVGNGAAELIRLLMEKLPHKIGVIRPTFEEYPNRIEERELVIFSPTKEGFRYTAGDVMSFFAEKEIRSLILINPDNPSGNYIPGKELIRLIEWSRNNQIRLIVDESFADFSDEENNTLLLPELLDENPQLVVLKSISKSYGVPGLRLGILASGDKDLVALLKKEAAIWNINSFAEFFLQIQEKYQKDYQNALARFREERIRFFSDLKRIYGVTPYPTKANYVLIEVGNGIKADALAQKLLIENNVLVKDLSKKLEGNCWLRLSIQNRSDNEYLTEALRGALNGYNIKNVST